MSNTQKSKPKNLLPPITSDWRLPKKAWKPGLVRAVASEDVDTEKETARGLNISTKLAKKYLKLITKKNLHINT